MSIGCPDLASGVQIWPAVSIFGQFWPILANLVHVASSYTHWVVLRGRRWALKSGIFFEKCGSNRHCGLKHCRAGRVAVSVARVVGWVEVEARDPRATASAQPPARTPTCARRCRALLMVPGSLRRGPVELSKNKCTRMVFRPGLNPCGCSWFGCKSLYSEPTATGNPYLQPSPLAYG